MPLKLFISYARDDTNFVEALIQTINDPPIENIEYFIDCQDIDWGNSVTPSIKQGIKECTDLLVIISEKSMASMWVGYEIGIADALEKNILMFLTQKDLKLPSFVSDINYKTCSDLEGVRDYLQSRASQPLVEEFLEKIGHKNNQIYRQIDSVYVPPAEFDEIKRTLEDERIVFVMGPRRIWQNVHSRATFMGIFQKRLRTALEMWCRANKHREGWTAPTTNHLLRGSFWNNGISADRTLGAANWNSLSSSETKRRSLRYYNIP